MECIQEIIELYYQISDIYRNLSRLEYDGDRNSVHFNELVIILKELVEKEKRLFANLYNEFKNIKDYEVVDNGDPFVKRLIDFMNFNVEESIEESDSEEEIINKIYDIQYAKLYKTCSRNVFLVYLSFLHEYIDSLDLINLRDKILSFKYLNAFVNHDVEECLIDNGFEIEMVNYVNLYFVVETLGLDINMCDQLIFDCFKDTIKITITQILSIKDSDYMNINCHAMSINNQAMLRAGLSLISKSDYEKNKDWIFNMINDLSNQDNQVSLSIINSIIGGIDKDKQRIRKISMRNLEI